MLLFCYVRVMCINILKTIKCHQMLQEFNTKKKMYLFHSIIVAHTFENDPLENQSSHTKIAFT